MKKVILFDIDLTLIDSSQITARTNNKMAKVLGVTAEEVEEAVKSYRETIYRNDFHPMLLVKELARKWRASEEMLLDAYLNRGVFEECLYAETKKVLRELGKVSRLGIFSEGFEDYQRFKIESTQLDKDLEAKLIFIRRRKRDARLVETWGQATVVDDNQENVEYLRNYQQITPVWLNRKSQAKMAGVKTIHSLEELENET